MRSEYKSSTPETQDIRRIHGNQREVDVSRVPSQCVGNRPGTRRVRGVIKIISQAPYPYKEVIFTAEY